MTTNELALAILCAVFGTLAALSVSATIHEMQLKQIYQRGYDRVFGYWRESVDDKIKYAREAAKESGAKSND